MRSLVSAAAVSALLLGAASLAVAQGPGGSPGGEPKPSAKDAGPAPGDKKGAPDKKEPDAMRETAPDKGDGRAGREDTGKKAAESPSDSSKKKDSTASDRVGDKADRKASDTGRKEETPKASAPGDDKADRKATDTRRKDETPKASAPSDDKADRKATDTRRKDETPKASGPETDRAGKTAAPRSDDKKGVELSEQKRTTVHEKLSRDRTRHVTNVSFTVSVGATVPRNVQVYELPSDVIEIAPEYRSYRYVWVGDEIVIIDPARYVVIAVVGGSSRSAGSSPGGRLTLTEAERRIVVKHISSYGGQAVRERIDIGGRIPESVTLMAFPEEVVTEVPRLRDYRYVFVQDDIAIVDPHDTTVLVKIDH